MEETVMATNNSFKEENPFERRKKRKKNRPQSLVQGQSHP